MQEKDFVNCFYFGSNKQGAWFLEIWGQAVTMKNTLLYDLNFQKEKSSLEFITFS